MSEHKGVEHHHKAAEHHEHAAKHHREAAKHHEAGDHEKAAHHAHTAHGMPATPNIIISRRAAITPSITDSSKRRVAFAVPRRRDGLFGWSLHQAVGLRGEGSKCGPTGRKSA